MIVAGYSSYPRILDFVAFAEIAKEVGAYLMVDMAHFAGLVAGGAHPSPVPHADFVTLTTHKTMRGPWGGGDPLPRGLRRRDRQVGRVPVCRAARRCTPSRPKP